MQRREYLLAAIGIGASTTAGAVAYSNASVTRDVTVNIAADNSAVIGLENGTTSAVNVTNGILAINTDTASSSGLNGDATFTYGDSGTPTTAFAFAIRNNDTNAHSFTVGLDGFTLGAGQDFSLTLYDTAGTLIGDATTGTDQSVDVPAGDAIYAHINIDTTGLVDGDSLTGTLRVDSGPTA